MTRVNTRKVGEAFREAREAQGHGSIRVEVRDYMQGPNDRRTLAIGYSYAEPVMIHDGRNTLRSIRTHSVTTAGHMGTLHGPGEVLPCTTRIMRDVAAGRMSFKDAERASRAALKRQAKRQHAAGVPVERCEDGYRPRWAYRTEDAFIWRDGSIWYCRIDSDGTTRHNFPTLKAARVALWSLLGITALGEWRDVLYGDFPEAMR
jgi:hypothetical protein